MRLVKAMLEIQPVSVTADLLSAPGGMPLIICSASPRLQKRVDAAGYKTIRVNVPLSKALLSFPKEDRPRHVEEELQKILDGSEPILLTDFEMLFDPHYEIDILKIFCERARAVNLAVRWPGGYTPSKLTYAAPEDLDYHEYNCLKYQIRVVR